MRQMRTDKATALQLKDLLTACLADAIDQAMLALAGPQWFEAFAEYDASEECETPILRAHQHSIHDCDMQALFKFLRYREPYAEAILEYYGFFDPNDQYGNSIKKGHFQHLLNRLITDFRNRMEAHTRAADLLTTGNRKMLYDYSDAVSDILKLAEIFRDVKMHGLKGMSYYKYMVRIAKKQRRKRLLLMGALVSTVLAACVGVGVWFLTRPVSEPEVQALAVTPISIDHYENGDLYFSCTLTNVSTHTITNIDLYDLVLKCGDKTVAQKNCGIIQYAVSSDNDNANTSQSIALALAPGESETWTFRFEHTTVINPSVITDGAALACYYKASYV